MISTLSRRRPICAVTQQCMDSDSWWPDLGVAGLTPALWSSDYWLPAPASDLGVAPLGRGHSPTGRG